MHDTKEICAVYAAMLATALACIYWLSRSGFTDNSLLFVMKPLGIAYFLFFIPVIAREVLAFFGKGNPQSGITSHAFLLIAGIVGMSGIGLLIPWIHWSPWPILSALGLVVFGRSLWRFYKGCSVTRFIVTVTAICLFSLWIARLVWTSGFQSPFFLELLVSGKAHRDTLYLSSISSMIKTYGIPSTGLHGVPYLPYHFGSSWIFAQFAKLIEMDTLMFYQIGYPLIFAPLFFYSLLLVVIQTKEYLGQELGAWDISRDRFFWSVFFLFLIGFLPSGLWQLMNPQDVAVSESYHLSLVLSFLTGAFLLKVIANSEKNVFTISALVFFVVVIAFLKISVGYLWIAVAGYLFFRLKLYRSKKLAAVFGIGITGFLLIFFLIVPRNISQFNPFYWAKSILSNGYSLLDLQFLFNYFWSVVYILYRTLSKDKRSFTNTIDIEIVVVLCMASLLPLSFFYITGGSYLYFTDVQRWVATVLLLSILPEIKASFDQIRLRRVVLPLMCLIFTYNLATVYKDFFGRIVYYRYRIIEGAAGREIFFRDFAYLKDSVRNKSFKETLTWMVRKLEFLEREPQRKIDENPRYLLLKNLDALDRLPLDEKKETVLYIPKSNRNYWEMLPCHVIPFVGPALGEIASIQGLPDKECLPYHYPSYEDIDLVSRKDRDFSLQELYAEALSKGFRRVLVLEKDGSLTSHVALLKNERSELIL